jgi:sugar phosphate permease
MPAAVPDAAAIDRRYRYWRVRVMYSMMIGYAVFYFVRININMAAKAITDEFQISNTQWGHLLSIATIIYGISKFLSGVLADVVRPKYIMATGLLVSAAINLSFGFGHTVACFTVLWAANNLFQGMGMPPCSRLLTRWYSPREIGSAWGLWNASHQIGGAIVSVGGGYLVGHYGWRSVFWVPGLIAMAVGVWLFNRLPDSPEAMGLPPVETYRNDGVAIASEAALPFRTVFGEQILRNPWVWLVSIANFFVYIVRIGILSWGPKYLQEAGGFSVGQAGGIQAAFEAAGIFGALLAGWLSDGPFRGRRGPVSVIFMTLLVAAVGALLVVPRGHLVLMSAIFASLGFLVYGPQLLVAVAAADFATKPAAASAVGLTGLFGYMGAAVCGTATGWLVDHHGWNAAVWFYLCGAVAGALMLALTWNKTTPALSASTAPV